MSPYQLLFMVLLLPVLYGVKAYIRKKNNMSTELEVFMDSLVFNGNVYMFDDYIIVSREHFLYLKHGEGEVRMTLKRLSDVEAIIMAYKDYKAMSY